LPEANSTSTSTSLSGPKSSRSTEPKSDSRTTPCMRQKAAIWSDGMETAGGCMAS
jgi:hypothetical protein